MTLNFWEENTSPSHTPQSPITVQVSVGRVYEQPACAGGRGRVLKKEPLGTVSAPAVLTDPPPTFLCRWSRPSPGAY